MPTSDRCRVHLVGAACDPISQVHIPLMAIPLVATPLVATPLVAIQLLGSFNPNPFHMYSQIVSQSQAVPQLW